MIQPYYVTQKDYMFALKQKLKIIDILNKTKHSILMLGSKMPDYWQDCHSNIIQMELVSEIEELLREIKNESS